MAVEKTYTVGKRQHPEREIGPETRTVSFNEAFRFWLKLGFISFGGPAGQIAIMHRELVERRRWISEDRFLHALNPIPFNRARRGYRRTIRRTIHAQGFCGCCDDQRGR